MGHLFPRGCGRHIVVQDRLVVPKKEALKKKIMDEAHTSGYSIHLGSTKMYHDLRQQFWCQNVILVRR
jgi:hypothetical protein